MNHLKNKNIKYLIIPMIILTIATSMTITIQTYNQYKKITITANQKIAEIIGTIIKEDPEIDTRTIIKTLNSKQDTEEYQKGQEELKKYGININEANSIIAVQNQMKQNMILNLKKMFLKKFMEFISLITRILKNVHIVVLLNYGNIYMESQHTIMIKISMF